MKDATREEVIDWCIEHKIDFVKGKYPPPKGWGWYRNDVPAMTLCSVFTIPEEDIDSIDVFLTYAARNLTDEAKKALFDN